MFWPVVSIAICAASRPLSAVCRPRYVGIVIARSHCQVEDAVAGDVGGRRGQPVTAGVVALVAAEPGELEEMVEEGQLLAHQRAVDVVLALDHLEKPAELRAARGGELRRIGIHHGLEHRHRDRGRVRAEPHAGASEQQHPLVLEQPAAVELGLEQPGQLDDRPDVAIADRRTLLEHDLEEPAGGHELRLEVREHLIREDDVSRVVDDGRAHDLVPSVEAVEAVEVVDAVDAVDAAPAGVPICGSIPLASWSAIPTPPFDISACVSAVGIMLANALVLGSEPRMPPEESSLESSELSELSEPSRLESSVGLETVEASSCVICCMRMSSKPSASW